MPTAPPADLRRVLSVHQVTRYLSTLIRRDPALGDLWVRGEVSNCTHHSSGHTYFTLKDGQSELRCALFREEARRVAVRPDDGLAVVCHGLISVYEARGHYQMIVDGVEAEGAGALYAAFEALKKRLDAEGLFAPERKQPLPRFPRRVAIITSPDGAVVRDFLTIGRRRWPFAHIEVIPSAVQGPSAAPQLVAALERCGARGDLDAIVLARGGGSLEELWAFNEEPVVRAIAACPIPVVSAVGHETDFTLADFAADVRAPTPSAAAELVFPDAAAVARQVTQLAERAGHLLAARWARYERLFHALTQRAVLTSPARLLADARQQVDECGARAHLALDRRLRDHAAHLALLSEQVAGRDPRAALARGFALVYRDGALVRSTKQVRPGDPLRVRVQDGEFPAEVTHHVRPPSP